MPRGRGRKAKAAQHFVAALTSAGALSAAAQPAWAWCRTTTCDPNGEEQQCQLDPTTGCMITGLPLNWRGGTGSPIRAVAVFED